jgi:hypothetical protein
MLDNHMQQSAYDSLSSKMEYRGSGTAADPKAGLAFHEVEVRGWSTSTRNCMLAQH